LILQGIAQHSCPFRPLLLEPYWNHNRNQLKFTIRPPKFASTNPKAAQNKQEKTDV
jgi:hypothetical protein